ncbi:MAG: Flp pilus assembly protein CpaB [Deltaproteobacteria bacterium]|nr:Flp pilus assembly protein CpaB [Deltaproteobacteria bacterium]
MNRKALWVSVAAVLVGLLLLVVYQRQFERETSGGPKIRILFAVNDLVSGEALQAAKLGFREIPEAYLEDRHIRQSDMNRVIGVQMATAVRANQALLWTDLATTSSGRRDLSLLVRTGMRAVTIRADSTSSFSGLIRAGDRVDVLATMSRTNGEGERVTLPLLQNVLVLAAGSDLGGEQAAAQPGGAASTTAGSAQPRTDVTMITLTVSLEEGALLVFAQDRGRLSLVMRNPDDINMIEGLPETTMNNLIQSRDQQQQRVRGTPAPQPQRIENITGAR